MGINSMESAKEKSVEVRFESLIKRLLEAPHRGLKADKNNLRNESKEKKKKVGSGNSP